ncbi:hypothetical protein KSP40_PGU012628 [Platanthera guangdongensis]|uniref:TLC domain-containing protein n=1 Tax=Platanthera guangdongensis TaxID=2320717 RepID=A0ABR2M8Q4_9ASPA
MHSRKLCDWQNAPPNIRLFAECTPGLGVFIISSDFGVAALHSANEITIRGAFRHSNFGQMKSKHKCKTKIPLKRTGGLGAYTTLCFSCGYFAYDQLDMLRHRLYSGWFPSILAHHLVLLTCFTLALYRHVTINYLILTLACEVCGVSLKFPLTISLLFCDSQNLVLLLATPISIDSTNRSSSANSVVPCFHEFYSNFFEDSLSAMPSWNLPLKPCLSLLHRARLLMRSKW